MKKKMMTFLFLAGSLAAGLELPDRMTADFTQTVRRQDSNETLSYRGKLVVDLPRIMLWRYKKPIPKTVCIEPRKAWVVEPELEQATLFHLDRTIALKDILQKAVRSDGRRYQAQFGGKTYLIETDLNRTVRALSYTDDMENRVHILFSDVDTAPVFETPPVCKIPGDFDIIDARY